MSADVKFSVGINAAPAKTGRDQIVQYNADIANSYRAVQAAAQGASAGINSSAIAAAAQAAAASAASFAAMQQSIASLTAAMAALNGSLSGLNGGGGGGGPRPIITSNEQLAASYSRVMASVDPAIKAQQRYDQALAALRAGAAAAGKSAAELAADEAKVTAALSPAALAAKQAAEENLRLAASYKQVMMSVDPALAQQKRFDDALAHLRAGAAAAGVSAAQLAADEAKLTAAMSPAAIEAKKVADSIDAVRRKYDETYAASAKYRDEMRNVVKALNDANVTGAERLRILRDVAAAGNPVVVAAKKEADALEALKARIDPASAALKRLDEDKRKLDAAFASGRLSGGQAEYDSLSAAIERSRVMTIRRTAAERELTNALGLSKAQMAALQPQINDVVSGLIMGQTPMMIFAQQSGQIVQALQAGGGEMPKFSAATLAMAGGFAAAAVAIIAATAAHVAYVSSAKEVDRVNRLYGASVGMTTGQLLAQADAIASSAHVSKLAARDIQNSYLATGKIGGQVMSDLTKITRDYAAATAQDVDKASSDLAAMFSDPAKAVDELNNKYRMFDDSQTQLIKNYQAQGQLERAQIIILDEMRNRIQGAGDRLAWYTKLWENAKALVVDAGSLVAPATKQEEADFIQKRLSGATGKLSSREVADLTVQLSALNQEINNDNIAAWAADVRADFHKTTVAVGDFARSVDPAQAATTAYANAQKLINDAIAKYPALQAQGTQALALYKAQLLDAMNPAQAFALEMERQGRVLEAAAGRARDFEQQRQMILQKRGAQPNAPLTPQETSDINAGLDTKYAAQAKDNHRIAQEAAEDAKILARAQASTSPGALVAAQGQIAYRKAIRETTDALHPNGDVQVAQQAKQDALAKGYAELSGQIGAQVTQINLQTQAQQRLADAAGQGEAAQRRATIENQVAAAAVRGLGDATRAALEQQEAATRQQIAADFAGAINLEVAANERLVAAMQKGAEATREAQIYNEAYAQTLRVAVPTEADFGKKLADNIALLEGKAKALDSKAFEDYNKQVEAQTRQLQLQQKLVGANPQQAARLRAEHDINELLIKQGRSYEGLTEGERKIIDAARERSIQNADLEQQIARQKDAYDTIANSLEKSFERVGDALVNAFVEGKGSAVDFGNVAKGILSSLLTDLVKMSVVRPLSNSLLGTNYGTIFDLGGGSAANQNGGGASTSGLVNFGVSKGLGYLWDKASGFLGLGGGSAASGLAAGVVPSASVQASQIAALQAVNPGFAASSYVPVAGGVNAAAGAPAASGVSLSGLGSIAGGALSLAGAGYSIGGYLGTLTNSKAVGGLAGGAAAGALAGTMAMPGIGSVIGAIIGGIAGMIGTQKATVGKTASADVTINAGGRSSTYGNVQTDNEGDAQVGQALGNALSGIFTMAAMGGGSLTKNFGIGQTEKDGLYVAGSVDYKKFGDDIAGLLRYTLLDQGGLQGGGVNTIAALKNTKAKDWEEAAKDIGLGASIDAGNTALREMVKTLGGVTDAAKKATTESFQPMFEELARAQKLGIDGAYVALATDQLAAYLDQLRNPPDYTQVQTDMAALTGQFQAAREAYAQLNPAMVAYVDQIEAETRARMAANLNKSLDGQINEAIGRGYVNQINGLMDSLSANARSLAAVGEPAARANDLYNASLTSLLRTLTADQLGDVARTFGGDIATLANTLSAAAAATETATRFETLFSQIRQENIQAEISGLTEQINVAKSAQSQWQNLLTSVGNFRASLLTGDLSPLSPKAKLDEAMSQFNAAVSAANGGDVTAAGQVQSLAQAALQAAKSYYASSEDYARIFDQVQSGLGGVESVASRQVSLQASQLSTLQQSLSVQQGMLDKLQNQTSQADVGAVLSGLTAGNLGDLVRWGQRQGSDVLMQVLQTADTRLGQAGNPYRYRAGDDIMRIADHMGTEDYLSVGRSIGFNGSIEALNPWIVAYNKQSAFEQAVKAWGAQRGYQDGGVVSNGVYGVDSVIARMAGGGAVQLAGGEGVLTAAATSAIGGAGAVDYINRNHALPANDRWGGNVLPFRGGQSGGSSGSDQGWKAVVSELQAMNRDQVDLGKAMVTELAQARRTNTALLEENRRLRQQLADGEGKRQPRAAYK